MSERINLDSRAADLITDNVGDTFDKSELQDRISEHVHEIADNVCIYNSWCDEIVQDYDHEYGSEAEDLADGSGVTYKASEWEKARTAYAYWVAYAALNSKALAIVDEISDAVDTFTSTLDALGVEVDADAVRISGGGSDPLGYFAPTSIDGDNVHLYTSGQCDGGNGASLQVGPVWLWWTWSK